jgi:hypothetical protein
VRLTGKLVTVDIERKLNHTVRQRKHDADSLIRSPSEPEIPPPKRKEKSELLAEAVVGEATGESLAIPEGLWGAAAIEQAARMEVDAWLEPIGDHLCKLEAKGANIEGSFSSKDADKNCASEFRVSTAYLLGDVLCIEESRRGQRESKRLADVMRTLGWRLAQHPIKVGKKTCRAYTKPKSES